MQKKYLFLSIFLMSISAVLFTNCDPAELNQDLESIDKIGGNTGGIKGPDDFIVCDMMYRPNKLKITVEDAKLNISASDIRKLKMHYFVGDRERVYDSCNPSPQYGEFSDIHIHNVNGNVEIEFIPETFHMFERDREPVSIKLTGKESCDDNSEVEILEFENQNIEWLKVGSGCNETDSGFINL